MKICVIGGTGFVGTHLINELVTQGHTIKVITRRPERHRHLKTLPAIKIVSIDFFGNKILERQIDTYDVVINLAGVLNSSTHNSFEQVHEQVAFRIAQATKAVGTPRLLHMSALNASDTAPSNYLRSKGRAQEKILAMNDDSFKVTVFSPSVIFGVGDSFFNKFAQLLSLMPVSLPLTCAKARFAPIYVGDVVDAFIHAMDKPQTYAKNYPLCGPETFTLYELVTYTAVQIHSRSRIIPLNNLLSKPLAWFMGMFPGAPITLDHYQSMQIPSVCDNSDVYNELGIVPHSIEAIVPQYLSGKESAGQMDYYRSIANR